jgi:hypothetical protein
VKFNLPNYKIENGASAVTLHFILDDVHEAFSNFQSSNFQIRRDLLLPLREQKIPPKRDIYEQAIVLLRRNVFISKSWFIQPSNIN